MSGGRSANIAARAGALSASHWKRATFGWLAFAVAAVLLGMGIGSKSLTQADMASGETAKGERILADANFKKPAAESVLVQSRIQEMTTRDPRFIRAIEDVVRALAAQPDVARLQSPLRRPANQISSDNRSALVQFDVKGKQDDAPDKVQPILDAVARVQHENPALRIEEFGFASAGHVMDRTMNEDFQRAEVLSLPITLVILILAFGALVAAGIPVVLAFSAVLAAVGLNAVLSRVLPAADATKSVILLIGMAVGVDYSLFYLRREREERSRGSDSGSALLRAAATSGQAVLISGGTVLIAMAGMLLAGNAIFTSVGIGAMIVVFAAMVGSLTVLPALLHRLGDRVEKGKVPLVNRFRRPAGDSRLWGAILKPVLRWPGIAALVSAGLLAAAALPALGMHTKLPSFTDLPHSLPIVRTFERVQAAFPGSQTPAEMVVKSDRMMTPAHRRAFAEFKHRALMTGLLYQPFHVFMNESMTVARVEFAIAGDGDNAESMRALAALRNDVIPPVAAKLPGTEVAVTGQTAGTHDFNELMKSRAPLVMAFVLGLAFVLLLLTFRSIVVPLKAIALNLLSVGAAYGILIMVFQWGNLEGVLGFKSNGAISSWLPLFLFVVLFGLSMDYHVFILTRVKELVDRGMKTEKAVERGIRTTAGTVTSAAIVMVAVFALFAGLRELSVKQMGFGLAVAVLIDATVVRAVLLPATMKLLGEWNWYFPRWLEWLPSLAAEGEAAPVTPRAPFVLRRSGIRAHARRSAGADGGRPRRPVSQADRPS